MFEFDPVKSALNKDKHGIGFVEAQALWLDEGRIEQLARSDVELRNLTVGQIDGLLWCAVFTLRQGIIRIISVRRARKNEAEAYDRFQNNRA